MTQQPSGQAGIRELLDGGFEGARAVVIGGAGGVGAETVRQLRGLGGRVVVASRRGGVPGLDARPPGCGEAVDVAVDITDPASIRALADWVGRTMGAVDILVNTAGVTRSVPLRAIEELDDETIDAVMASNAVGVLRVIRDFTPLLRAGTAPCVVNVSSVAARTGVGSNVAYVGAKAAVDAMTHALAKALGPEIRLLSVAPSALETDFAKARSPDFIARTIAATPMGRLATPTEVANAILVGARLLTMTTGSTIYVDGGRHL